MVNLQGVFFHAVIIFGLGLDFLFKSILDHCGSLKTLCILFLERVDVYFAVLESFGPLKEVRPSLYCNKTVQCRQNMGEIWGWTTARINRRSKEGEGFTSVSDTKSVVARPVGTRGTSILGEVRNV